MTAEFNWVAGSTKVPADIHQAQQQLRAEPPAPPSVEEIHAVDAAFTGPPHEPDLAAGLLTLWANMPFLLEMSREHFPGRETPVEDEEPRDD